MSGFKKFGVYPLNPVEVTDWQLAPSKAVHPQPELMKTPMPPLIAPYFLLNKKHCTSADLKDITT